MYDNDATREDEIPGQLRFAIDEHEYLVVVADERPDVDLDPTLAIYRDLEEEPIAVIHLDPEAPCSERRHLIAPAVHAGD